MTDTAETMEAAVQCYQAGGLRQANKLYELVPHRDHNHPFALHSLGVIAYQQGRYDDAVNLIGKAIARNQWVPEFHNSIAVVLKALGKLEEAVSEYEQAVLLKPGYADAYNNMGNALLSQGQYAAAAESYKQAVLFTPDCAEAYRGMAIALQAQGQFDAAIEMCRQALLLKPAYAEAYSTMAVCLQEQGKYTDAIESCKKALMFRPDFVEAYNHLGTILDDQGRYSEATESYTRAVQLKPDYAEAYNNRGITLRAQGKLAEAIADYGRAIRLKPHSAEPYYNLADAQRDLGRCEQAIANYDRAIQLKPNCAQAHWNKALALLLSGNLAEGWKAYQWRHNPDLKIITYPHCYEVPRWDGSSFRGKTLLVHYEQGIGDTLQFVRYLPMVKDRGGTVILEARKPLIGLLREFPDVDDLVEASDKKPAVKFDFHASLMDLPQAFGTTLETIPSNVPYLHAASEKIEHWKDKLAKRGFKVGIVWAGSPVHGKDHIRSCPLEYFAPLARIPGVRLYGLQKGPAAKQVEEWAGKVPVLNLADQFGDFTDTAAAIANLDLIISVDTAVLHLAGAMGRHVWALLPFTPDWRWMLNRQDSLWYPTMRLFRQKSLGDWRTIFHTVAEQLQIIVQRHQVVTS